MSAASCNESLPVEGVDLYAVQFSRVVLPGIDPFALAKSGCETVAMLFDVRFVSGGGREDERWRVIQAAPLEACPHERQ